MGRPCRAEFRLNQVMPRVLMKAKDTIIPAPIIQALPPSSSMKLRDSKFTTAKVPERMVSAVPTKRQTST
ncbi:hypothetical protein D9M68_428340 [compost metagenome]